MIRIFMIGMSTDKGGVEAYITNLCSQMNKGKFEVVFCWPEMQIDGKLWICPPNRHNYLKYVRFWRRFYKENHFDVLYLNTCDVVSIDPLKFAKAAGVPIRIIHSHSTGIQQGIQRKMSRFHQFSERRSRQTLQQYATHLFACSKNAGDWMFDGRPYHIIKNGIQLSKYQFTYEKRVKIREKFGYGEERLVGIIGRLDPQKNVFFAIKILETLLTRSGIKAVFVGDGEQRSEVETAVKNAGLDQKVQFVGAVDNVNEWMSAIDCLLMTSLFEGLPFVLVEAQAAGVPCVVSSAVSEEANITGLLEYVSLEERIDVWAGKVMEACQKERLDTTQQLIEAGYSITETAKTVSEVIVKSLEKV